MREGEMGVGDGRKEGEGFMDFFFFQTAQTISDEASWRLRVIMLLLFSQVRKLTSAENARTVREHVSGCWKTEWMVDRCREVEVIVNVGVDGVVGRCREVHVTVGVGVDRCREVHATVNVGWVGWWVDMGRWMLLWISGWMRGGGNRYWRWSGCRQR